MPLLSAHRCGAEADRSLENTREALERSLSLGTEFVEFDVQRCRDGAFVLFHDDHAQVGGGLVPLSRLTFDELTTARGAPVLRYEDALTILAGRKRAHIDLKFVSPAAAYADPATTFEVAAVRLAVERMGAEGCIVTTNEDASVRAIRDWSRTVHPELLVGLSLGRDLTGRAMPEVMATRASELFPTERILACDANLVVANKALARATLARFAHRRGLPLLIWTVDDRLELRRWLGDARTWMVTTNFPRLAEELRARYPQRTIGRAAARRAERRAARRAAAADRRTGLRRRGTNRPSSRQRGSATRGRRLDR